MEWMLEHFLTVVITVFSSMSLAWLIYRVTLNPGIVDVFWGLGLLVAGTVLVIGESWLVLEKLVILIMLWLWGLRLSFFLYLTRVAKQEKDARYMGLVEKWGEKKYRVHLQFLINFLFQAFLQSILAWGFLLLSKPNSTIHNHNSLTEILFSFPAILVIALFIVGWLGETIADLQLYRFKKNIKNKGLVCDIGLWGWSRHPNYFFEFLIWLSMSLWTFLYTYENIPVGAYIAFSAPVILLYIFFVLTIPLTESHSLKKRSKSYVQYQKRVSVFVPWFSKS